MPEQNFKCITLDISNENIFQTINQKLQFINLESSKDASKFILTDKLVKYNITQKEDNATLYLYCCDNSKYMPIANDFTYLDLLEYKTRLYVNHKSYAYPKKLDEYIVGANPKIKAIKEQINLFSQHDENVFITGNTGTGKELVAKAIHALSKRKAKPCIAINCGAIPPDLIESELFGYEKGAFTGAYTTKKGIFEQANNGTVFLDEIGEMPLLMQVKMLRALQEKAIAKIGSVKKINIDVRVIAATHKNIKTMVKSGSFREDLYYRLYILPLQVPSLKDRIDDLPALIELFSRKYSNKDFQLSKQELIQLYNHLWPGNIRELQNLIKRTLIYRQSGDNISINELLKM